MGDNSLASGDGPESVFRSVTDAEVSLDEMLSLACRQGKQDIVELLLESGAKVNYRNKAGNTPLLEACSQGHVTIARLLLDRNADIDAPTETTSDSALTWACTLGNEEVVQLLLEYKAAIEHRTRDGCTALMFAALAGHDRVARLLLEHGARLNVESDSNKDSPLTFACWKGHQRVVELFLEQSADIEHRTKEGFSPLMFAALGGHTEVAQLLLVRGAQVNSPSGSNNDIPLTSACWKGHHDVVELLLQHTSNIEHHTKDGCTPLMLAAREGHLSVAQLLLSHHAKVNVPSGSENNIPLTLACWKGHCDVVELLLQYNSNIEHQNKAGCTPLMLAAREGHFDATELLLDHHAKINEPSGSNDDTPLTLACWKGHDSVVSLLLSRQSDVNHQTKTGCTPLMEATREGHVVVARMLLEAGADVETPDNYGQTPFFMACWKGHAEVASLLLEYGANKDCRTKTSITPFFQACRENHVEVVRLLLDYGCNPSAAFPNSRECPLTLAAEKGYGVLAQLLISRNANVECRTKKGCTPFFLACKEGFLDIAIMLAKHGADIEATDQRGVTPLLAAYKSGHIEAVEWLLAHVAHLPSDVECQKGLMAPKATEKDVITQRSKCLELIMKAKKAREQAALKNAQSLFDELDAEKEKKEIKKKAAARRRSRRKERKRKEQQEKAAEPQDKEEEEKGEPDEEEDDEDEEEEESKAEAHEVREPERASISATAVFCNEGNSRARRRSRRKQKNALPLGLSSCSSSTSTCGVSRGSVQTQAQAEGESMEEEDSAEDMWEDASEFLPDAVNNHHHGLCRDVMGYPDLLNSSGRATTVHSNPRENPEGGQKEKAGASRQQQQQHLASAQHQGKAAQPKKLSKQLSKPPANKNSKSPSQLQQQQPKSQPQQEQGGSGGRGDAPAQQSKKSSKNFPGTSDAQPRSPVDKRRRERPPSHGGGSNAAAEGSSASSLDRSNARLHLPVSAAATTAAAGRSGARSDSPLQRSPVNPSTVGGRMTAAGGGQSVSTSAGRLSPVVAYANGGEGSWSSQEPPTVSDDWGSGNDNENIDDAISKCSTDDDKIRSQQHHRTWTPITTVASSTTAMSTTASSSSSSCSLSSRPWQEVSRAIKTCQLTVANSLVGRIIGRRGSKINQIQEASGAQISISRAIPRSVERLVTIKGTDRSLNKARELIEEALSTPSREIESDHSPQMLSLSSATTDSSGHAHYVATTHSVWSHRRQPEPVVSTVAVASSSSTTTHLSASAVGLGPSSFATAVTGNAGSRRPANAGLVPVATTAAPPELGSRVATCVTSQQLVSGLGGERGGETRGNVCAASSPSPSCATPTSSGSVTASSSEPTTLTTNADTAEQSLPHSVQDNRAEEGQAAAAAAREEEESGDVYEDLQSPHVHTRSGSEPLLRCTSSVRPSQASPTFSLPSLGSQPSNSFSLGSFSPQISVSSPSHDPAPPMSSSISIISSTSFSQLVQEDNKRDGITVSSSTPVVVNSPVCPGPTSADSSGTGACGFGAIGPPNRRSSVPSGNSLITEASPERKLSYAGIPVSKGLSSVPEFHPTSSSLSNSFTQREYSWPPTAHAPPPPPPPAGPNHAPPPPPPGHMAYNSWRNNGWPPQAMTENERTRSQSWAGLVQPFGPVASSHQETPANLSNSFSSENHTMWADRPYHPPPSQFRPQFNRPHSSAAVYGNLGAGVQASGFGDPFPLGTGSIRPVQSYANHGHMPGHGHTHSQHQSQQLPYNVSYFPNSSAPLRSQPHSHFQSPHSQNYFPLQPHSHSSLPRSQTGALQSQQQQQQAPKPRQQPQLQQLSSDSNNSPLSLRQVLGEKLEREIFPGEGGLSMDFKDDSPSHSKRWSVSSFPPNFALENSSGTARDSSTWGAPSSLTSNHGRHSVVGASPSLRLNDHLFTNLTSWPIWSNNSTSAIAPPSLFSDTLPTTSASGGGGGAASGSGESNDFSSSNWDQASPAGGGSSQDQQDDSESDHDGSADLYTLMRRLDIAEHIPALQNQNLSLQQLCAMSDEEWRGLKLPVGPRVKLMNAVANIAAARSSGGNTLDVDGVSDPPFSSASTVGQ